MDEKSIGILIVIFGTIIGAIAAYLIKNSTKIHNIKTRNTKTYNKKNKTKHLIQNILTNFANRYLLFGLLLYAISALIYIKGISYVEVSIAYPMTSLTWVWSFILATAFLKEKITPYKVIGLMLILIGVYFVVI